MHQPTSALPFLFIKLRGNKCSPDLWIIIRHSFTRHQLSRFYFHFRHLAGKPPFVFHLICFIFIFNIQLH